MTPRRPNGRRSDGVVATRLDGGLTVVTERMPGVRSAAVGFWVGTGSVDEPAPAAGASHFLEHLLFKGSDGRTARDIADAIDGVGGDMNAYTTKEYTAFYVRVLGADAPMAVDILSDIIWRPAFRPEEVEAERKVILEEILMHGDEPADLVHDAFAEALYPGHPLGREVLGDAGTVAAMTGSDIAAFHGHHYRPANVVVAAAGAIDHDWLVAALADRAGDRCGGQSPRRGAPGPAAEPLRVVERDTEQAHLVVGVRGPARADEDRWALGIVDHVLGGGLSSRLFQTVREERGLAYSIYSYRLAYEHTGALAVYAGTAPAYAAEVLNLIDAECDRMASDGPSPAELDAARRYLRGSTALGLEDSGARMTRIACGQLLHGEVLSLEEIDARFEALTVEQVREVAARVLGAPRTLAVVGPFTAADFAGR